MSDNVVLSKHFDSLASAIQRCLSAGYAPTAYIPAGHESVIDNVASTVDGGMWYEVNGNIPTLKMHYGNRDYVVNLLINNDAYLVTDLNFRRRYVIDEDTGELVPSGGQCSDLCGGTWTQSWSGGGMDVFTAPNGTLFLGIDLSYKGYTLTQNEDFNLGGQDFTISFWYKLGAMANGERKFFTMYSGSSSADFVIYFSVDSTRSSLQPGVKLFGSTYLSDTVTTAVENAHFELDYVHETNSLKLFINGELNYTISHAVPLTTFNPLVLGIPSDDSGDSTSGISIAEFKIYNGIALHADNFTPTYTALSAS